ncbi:MAG: MoaD/ThiS family protein, partial [Gallionella sp.]
VDSRELQLEYQAGLCLKDVIEQLKARNPKAFEIVCFTAVNEMQTQDMQLLLADSDEVAFMAKYSGG